jgi:hypothetical protein
MEQIATNDTRSSFRKIRFLQEVALVGACYLVYSQVRGLAADRVVDAFGNAYRIVELEQKIGIFEELALQTYLLPNEALMHAFNFVYFYALWPLLLPTAIWLYFKRPSVYTLTRNAFLISGFIAVCFYVALPTAPPRLIGMGFIDTVAALSSSFAPTYKSIPGMNHFAALPSMHVGWNFLIAVSIFLALSGFRWRFLVLLLPVTMFTATVVTGNHYFIDGLLGMLVASTGLGIAMLIHRRDQRRRIGRKATEGPDLVETSA